MKKRLFTEKITFFKNLAWQVECPLRKWDKKYVAVLRRNDAGYLRDIQEKKNGGVLLKKGECEEFHTT